MSLTVSVGNQKAVRIHCEKNVSEREIEQRSDQVVGIVLSQQMADKMN